MFEKWTLDELQTRFIAKDRLAHHHHHHHDLGVGGSSVELVISELINAYPCMLLLRSQLGYICDS